MKSNYIFLMFSLIAILLLNAPLSSALGEVASFNSTDGDYGSYTIEGGWGILPGWLGGDEKAWIKLEENTDVCLINCHAELEGYFYEEEPVIESFELINKRGQEVTSGLSDLKFEIGTYQNVSYEVPTYEEVCFQNSTTSTTDCFDNQTGTHEEIREELVWEEYLGEGVEGYFKFKISAKKNENIGVDWIVGMFGEKLDAWAWWDSLDGNFEVFNVTGSDSWTVPSGVTNISLLVVAGGGGGSKSENDGQGGGGAGGVVFRNSFTVTSGESIDLIVGDGGDAHNSTHTQTDGEYSYFNATSENITAIGGGKANDPAVGGDGGSGAGGRGDTSGSAGGSGLQPGSTSGGYGNDGGAGNSAGVGSRAGGGGGGAGSAGVNGATGDGGDGGSGVTIWGEEWGIGGDGSHQNSGAGADGRATYGDGGGGAQSSGATQPGGQGGSGIVVVRYLTIEAVEIKYPENITYSSIVTELNYTNVSALFDCWYSTDLGVTNSSPTVCGSANFTGLTSTEGSNTWIVYANNSLGDIFKDSVTFTQDTTPFIEFLSPPTLPNYANVSQDYIPMKVNVSTDYFKNITYHLQHLNGTIYTKFFTNQTYDINFTNVADGHYHYNVTVCTTTNQCNTTETRHINHDITPPIINVTYPTGTINYLIENLILDLNWTVTDEQLHLDSCWYVYDNQTTSINCSLNTTQFNYSTGENSINFYANDTFGNTANQTATWDYLILDQGQTYDAQVTEGTPNTITKFLNVQGDTISTAILSYNGTNYTTSLDYDAGNYTIASTVVAPLVDADVNITFKFYVVISGVTYPTTETTQLIQAINFSTCTTGDKLLNLFLKDEGTKADLSGTIEINAGLVSKISGEAIESVLTEVNNTSNLSICLDPISSVGNFYLDADIVYSATDHAKEFYFMRQANLSTIPINLSLFDLNLSSSTEFLLRYQGQTLTKVEGAIIQLQRYYVSEGMYETVEAPLTSISGTAVAHIDLNTNKYRAVVVKDGEVLDIFDDIVFDCENELAGQCTQNLYADVTPYNIIDGGTSEDFSYAISDTGAKLVTTFSIPSGSTSAVNIVMTQRDQFGNTTSCNRTVTTSSGTLECDYNQTIGDSYLTLEINKNGEFQAEKEYFVPEANGIEWDGLNWLFLFVFLISLSLMAISSPEWIIGNAVITFVIGGALWIAGGMSIVMGLGLLLWLIVAAIILILELAKQEDR